MATKLPVALFNYESGGRTSPGQYDFTKLQDAFKPVEEAPALILLNEAKEWHLWGSRALFAATNALSDQLGRAYEGRMGVGVRGPGSAPALMYDPQVVRLDFWGDDHELVHSDKWNLAEAHILGRSAVKFKVLLQHWDPFDKNQRLKEANEVSQYRKGPPTLLGGDLNSSASGPAHTIPRMNWELASEELREQKAIQLPDGTWVEHTAPVDRLIGRWDGETGKRLKQRVGWYALAEIAYETGTPASEAFVPTVNRRPEAGGGLIIDWLVVNEAWKDGLVAGTYGVHMPDNQSPEEQSSDHRLVTATLEL